MRWIGPSRTKGLEADRLTEHYLVHLLAAYAAQPIEDRPLALRLLHAIEASPRERRATLREIGDTSLFVSGFWGDSLDGKLVDVDYYIDMGGTAYGELARGASGGANEPFGPVFAELASNFARFVEVLMTISRRTARARTDRGIVRLYERWMRTKKQLGGATPGRTRGDAQRPGDRARVRDGSVTGLPARRDERRSVLSRLQLGIEALYRVDTRLDVESFLINDDERRHAGVARAPREQLLVKQDGDDELKLGLFVDRQAVSNLEHNDPALRLDHTNFADFCLAVEGVSHFVYVALCAAGERSVSALELELQAEVDKFACCLLVAGDDAQDENDAHARGLRRKLYNDVTFAEDLDGDERNRYRVANLEARRYAETLSRRFVSQDRLTDMLPELRRFYRLDLDGKLGHIARITG